MCDRIIIILWTSSHYIDVIQPTILRVETSLERVHDGKWEKRSICLMQCLSHFENVMRIFVTWIEGMSHMMAIFNFNFFNLNKSLVHLKATF